MMQLAEHLRYCLLKTLLMRQKLLKSQKVKKNKQYQFLLQ